MTTITPTTPGTGASDKQAALIGRLAAEKSLDTLPVMYQYAAAHPETIPSRKAASNLIDRLMALPRGEQATTTDPTPGYYKNPTTEAFYVVTEAKSSGNVYAKVWATAEQRTEADRDGETYERAGWMYAPGVRSWGHALVPITLDEAKAFGHLHGVCIKCGRALSDPASVEAGIGPVCATYFG